MRGQTELMRAIIDGRDAPLVDIDAFAEGGDCALSLAIAAGREALVARLIAAGADSGIRGLLQVAAKTGSIAIVRMLLDAGARIEAIDGESPLDVAIANGHDALVDVFLEGTLDESIGHAAFTSACRHGRLAAVQSIWKRYESGVPNAVAAAAIGGDPRVIEFLAGIGQDLDDFDLKDDISPLMHAVKAGNRDAVRVLVARGAHVDAQTEWSVTPLGLAEASGDAAMIALVKSLGGTESHFNGVTEEPYWRRNDQRMEDVVARDDLETLRTLHAKGGKEIDGTWYPPVRAQTVLELAVPRRSRRALAWALERGADPNVREGLLAAITVGDGECVRMLLANAAMSMAITSAACRQRDPWILADVLAAGAPADGVPPQYQQRPIEIAADLGHRRHAELLLARGAKLDAKVLLEAAGSGRVHFVAWVLSLVKSNLDEAMFAAVRYPALVEMLVARGANRNARNADGDSLLHLGAKRKDHVIDPYLALAGDMLEVRGRLGWTPLHCAVCSGTPATVEKLLAAGAKIDARDDDHRTPLHLADRPAMIDALVAAGAEVDALDKSGATALHRAASGGPELVARLLAAGADRSIRDREGKTPLDRGLESLKHFYGDHAARKAAVALLQAG